jgi:hypothetical protein
VTERVMLVNVGNQPHRDYGEGLAPTACPLPASFTLCFRIPRACTLGWRC